MKNKINILVCVLALVSQFATAQTPKLKIGNNPTTMSSAAALEIESNSKGLLISRLTTAQRDAITTPANGLMIWNTTNNSLEVFKTTCSCWVSISDGGNYPAASAVNTAPSATSLNYTGKAIVGQPFTIVYSYFDAQNDPEGSTGIQWEVASSAAGASATKINGATTASYTPIAGNAANWIRAVVTPRATSGVLNGVPSYGDWVQVDAANTPTANSLTVTGTPMQGSLLTATYTFAGGSGTENTSITTGSSIAWQTASTNTGQGISTAPLYGASTFERTYLPQADLIGRFVRSGIRAKDSNSLQASNFVYSPWVGPITSAPNTAPTATNIAITPSPAVGNQLSAVYAYFDANNDPEGVSTFQWFRADDVTGTNQTAIAGATSMTYTPTNADAGKFIGFGVTPIAQTGTLLTGTQVVYYHPSAVLNQATFAFTATAVSTSAFFSSNRIMNADNNIQVEINVTATGGISFSTNTVNGYSFNGNYTASSTGNQWVTLTAVGTQSAYNVAGDSFILTAVGASTQTKNFTVVHSAKGSDLTAFSNGSETFNNNSNCSNKLISASHTVASCSGNVVVGSNTYPLVLINGQCWMQTNLKQAPTAPCAAAINTGCNVWLAASVGDKGSYGYYNLTILDGSAGWATTEPAANEGLLYQWSAAMNGSTQERAQGVCPSGFHIPSDCEWMYLEHGQGMTIAQQTLNDNWRNSTNEGNKLRGVGGSFTNSSGFTSLITGFRNVSGSFSNRASMGGYWTSTLQTNLTSIGRLFASSQPGVRRFVENNAFSIGVRCIKN